MKTLAAAARSLRDMTPDRRFGRVIGVRGTLIEVEGLDGAARIGSHITVTAADGVVAAEVTGLDRSVAHCLPFSDDLRTGGACHVCCDAQRAVRGADDQQVDGAHIVHRFSAPAGRVRSASRQANSRSSPPRRARSGGC